MTSNQVGCGILLFVALILTVLVQCSQQEAPVEIVSPYSTERVAQCEKLLEQSEGAGLIRARPSATRIDVEDVTWRALPADSKKGVALGLACAAFGKPLAQSEYVVVYGYRSGKRLAMATSVGVNLE